MQVKFNENNIAYVTFYKWDYGQSLIFDNIPENSEVHFPVKDSTNTAVVKIIGNTCSIPNSTLSMDLNSFDAWLYVDNGEQGKTKKTIHFTLVQRPKPEEHIYPFEEDKVLDFNRKLDKFQGAENAGKSFVVDSEGNAVLKHPQIVTIDTKLSETSSNAIANSAVAKVLDGGKLVGIETVYDYESFMDFYTKFYDFENDELLIAEDEYFVVPAIDDIYDESGEYNDTSTILERGIYIFGGSFDFTIGTVTESGLSRALLPLSENITRNSTSIQSISNKIKTLPTNETLEQFQNVITLPEKHITNAIHSLRAAGVYIVDCETTEIVIGNANKHLITMSKGEIIMVSINYIEGTPVRPAVAFTKQGIKHFPNLNADNIENLRYLSNTETEKLVDDKLAELEQSSKWKVIQDVTLSEDVGEVRFTEDMDGNPFSVRKMKIFIIGSGKNVRVNFYSNAFINTYFYSFLRTSTPGASLLTIDEDIGGYRILEQTKEDNSSPTYNLTSTPLNNLSKSYSEKIESIRINNDTAKGGSFNSGTRILIMGIE